MAEAAYPRTPAGEVELKELPSRLAYEATGVDDAFRERNALFGRNFRFLRENRIEMTTPVEVDLVPPAMRFFVPHDTERGALRDVEGVDVRQTKDRLVVSVGMRGGYSRARFEAGRGKAAAWLAAHPELEATGPGEVAYWHGPMMPAFLRRFEVHVPVRRKADQA